MSKEEKADALRIKVQQWMDDNNLSLREASRLSGCSHSAIGNLIAGKTKVVRTKMLTAMSAAMGCEVSQGKKINTTDDIENMTLKELGLRIVNTEDSGVYIVPPGAVSQETIWLGGCKGMQDKSIIFNIEVKVID